MNKIALGISCWNRPQYLRQLISSLEANSNDLADIDYHLFIDGDICSYTNIKLTDISLINECIDIWDKALLPDKQLHRRFRNIGTAIQQFEMMQMLTNVYERIIFLEDDVIVSPNFIFLMKKILVHFEKDNSIFSVSPGFKLLCKVEEIDKYTNAIKFIEGHFWAEAIWSHKWKQIVPLIQEYINIIKEKEYRSRNDQKIKDLFIRHGRSMLATSQDNAKDWAISRTKMKRARFIINRATGVGNEGVHSTAAKLARSGDGHNQIYILKDERLIDNFRIV